MPTYDYKCNKCGHTFEIMQSIKDEPLKKCLKCGEDALQKLISAGAGLIFKGSGFYLTDYKNKSTNIEKNKMNGLPSKNKKKDTKTKSHNLKEIKKSNSGSDKK
jgi:putative FmdB family regulatory protein